jgi:hypothetical protein
VLEPWTATRPDPLQASNLVPYGRSARTAGEVARERGQTTLLIVGILMIAMVAQASAAYLRRQ